MFSYFNNVRETKPSGTISLDDLIKRMQDENDEASLLVRKYRNNPMASIKHNIPAITPAGIFEVRNTAGFQVASGFIHCDLDNVENPDKIKEILKNDRYVCLAFTSPGGRGVKVFARADFDKNNYKKVILSFCAYIHRLTGIEPDQKCKDLPRLCFLSYDNELVYNKESDLFVPDDVFGYDDIDEEPADMGEKIPASDINNNDVFYNIFEYIIKNVGFDFVEGQRNAWINKVVWRSNRAGIPKENIESYLIPKYVQNDFTESEIRAVINSVYANLSYEFGKYKGNYYARVQGGKIERKVIDEKGKIDIDYLFTEVMEKQGLYIYINKDNTKFVTIERQKIVDEVTDDYMKRLITATIEKFAPEKNKKTIIIKNKNLLQTDALKLVAPNLNPRFLRNTLDEVYFPFQDNVVRITKEKGIEIVSYENVPYHIWKTQVINKKGYQINENKGEFEQFCRNISGDNERFIYLKKIIGYLISGIDTPANRRSVILTDYDGTDNPSGGTGKGLLCEALSYITSTVSYDGKALDLKSYKFSKNEEYHRITILQDTERNFDFELLFSTITDGMSVRKMYKGEFIIPVKLGNKIVITTNHLPRGVTSSFKRRQYIFVLKRYYSDEFTPRDEFKHDFFYNWNEEEWNKFYTFLFSCVLEYIQDPFFKQLETNTDLKLQNECGDLLDYFEELELEREYVTGSCLDELRDNEKIFKHPKTFYRLLQNYCTIKGYILEKKRVAGKRGFIIHSINENENNENENELPF
jgi:hypothetical protein